MVEDARPHFEVHPSVVYQLGESLISDAIQALIELVKNCYDADASYAKVTIDTQGVIKVDGAIYPSEGGRIIIEDDGHGMDLMDIETGWLTISNRKKRELKQAKRTTPGGRTPLGDKGLGRLGVQRLGENLEIFTKSSGGAGYHFGFSWLDFATAPKLQDVDIHLADSKYPHQHGTKVVVSGVRDPDIWRGQDALKRLEQELSRMISPYKQIRDFTVVVEVDGKPLELLEITDRIRNIAPVRYSLSFDGKELVIKGRARLDFFRPANQAESEQFALIVEADDGQAFFDFLQAQKLAETLGLSRSRSRQWFVKFRWQRPLANLDKVQRILSGETVVRPQDRLEQKDQAEDSKELDPGILREFGGDTDEPNLRIVANPGPFEGEVDSFDLGQAAFQNQSVFDRISEYRKHVKELSGIRVYRDGFAIRVDHDWLNLGAQWTSAPSYYGLKPDNTLGYIALSARDNMELEETTDREGFKDSPYYRNFYALLGEFKAFTTKAHEFFRRSWIDFRKVRNEALAHVDSRKTVEDLSQAIKDRLAEAPQHQKRLDVFKARLGASVSASKTVASRLQLAKEITPELRGKVTEALSDLEPLLVAAKEVIGRLSAYLEQIASLQGMGQVLEDRVEGLRRQMDDMYETVALGLTAEALSHEVYNVADQLAKRAKSAQTTLRNKGITDRPLLAFIEYVQSAVMALRKQMSFLSPSLRYVREQRHDIDIREFVAELAEFYSNRLGKSKITMKVLCSDTAPFVVRMNRGKLTQVIDNLVLNSEYWIKEDIAQGRLDSGSIDVDISRPFVRLSDDGSGVDPSVEYALFEPFVSAKEKGQGRGLGLFIVKQLLDSEGCRIDLLPERNRRRRLFKFQIDLRGALHE
jgi:signal transduction histidine kinase